MSIVTIIFAHYLSQLKRAIKSTVEHIYVFLQIQSSEPHTHRNITCSQLA